MRRNSSPTSRGFTLLEAIVAVTIIAMALIPLVSYIAQASNELMHAGESNERSLAMQSALALMEPINPYTEPKGQLALDSNTNVVWDSEAVVKPNDNVLVGGGLANFRLGFYTIHVSLTRHDDTWFTFDMRKIGYDRMTSGFPMGDPGPPSATPPGMGK